MGAAIGIEHVSKRFRLYHGKTQSLKERVIQLGRLPHEDFWALRDVSIDVERGETIGLLGHNGSGKSTLLKCIAGILRPTSGRVVREGRIAALLELGSGMHPDLTGRENVFLNGSILGIPRAEINRIFDDIVEFAELGPFIDNQVKHYSSGMSARLGFAVAVNVDPEILLVDEVLAVGDEAFQRKCLERIKRFQREGRTILLVTHNADLVHQVCNRAAVLDQGAMVFLGEAGNAVLAYRESLLRRGLPVPEESSPAPTGLVRFTDVGVEYGGRRSDHAVAGDPVRVRVAYTSDERVEDVVVTLRVSDRAGTLLLGASTEDLGVSIPPVDGPAELVFELGRVPLQAGLFDLELSVHGRSGTEYDHRAGIDHFEVSNPGHSVGLVDFVPRVVLVTTEVEGIGSGEVGADEPGEVVADLERGGRGR